MPTIKLEAQQGGGGGGASDFDELTNRPLYDGEPMSHETSIPDVEDTVSAAVEAEAEARTVADSVLTQSIAEEASTRETQDGILSALITEEATTRSTAVLNLTNTINIETAARQTADTALQGQIDAITSSSDVVDVVGTHEELEEYDTSKLHDNDIVKVLVDETKDNAISYYRWHNSAWSYIGSQGPFYTKSESDVKFNGKVDKVTNMGLSSNDYTDGEKDKLAGIETGAQKNLLNTVTDANYVHTDNNYTTAEKTKLAGLSNYDDTEIKADLAEVEADVIEAEANIAALEVNKVDVESGKGLSTNDYTTAEKTKLAGLDNYDDTEVKADIASLEADKQDKLTAGENITIDENNVISASGNKPYLSLERNGEYLYTVTFDKLPEENGDANASVGGCTSFVRDGKLYRNLDWNYDNTASFHVITKDFEGISFINSLNSSNLDDDLIAQLPYRMNDGVNKYGIMVSTHVLFNDWGWTGTGETSITKIPYLILKNAKSMATLSNDISEFLGDIVIPQGLRDMGYMLQFLVTDGVTTKIILPPTEASGVYSIVTANTAKKLTNFRWVDSSSVVRTSLQTHPTGVERWNEIGDNTTLEDLRFTKAYEAPTRLSEFIGIDGTTKDSTDEELEAIYDEAHTEYIGRQRDGKTWQSMHSVVYGANGMERLYVQEEYDKDYIYASRDYVDEAVSSIDVPELLPATGQSTTAGMTQKAITDALATAGGVKVLTAADYNWPTDNPLRIAAWALPVGTYVAGEDLPFQTSSSVIGNIAKGKSFVVFGIVGSGEYAQIYYTDSGSATNGFKWYRSSTSGLVYESNRFLSDKDIKNNLTTTGDKSVLDARQGKVLKDLIDARVPAPTSGDTDKFLKGDGTWAEAGEDNVQADWEQTDTTADDYIKNKPEIPEGAILYTTTGQHTDGAMTQKAVTDELASLPSVIDNVTSTSTTDALSANQGKVLNDRIDNIESRGRYLSTWDATTGLPETEPEETPYAYRTGDYFIVSNVGTTNYKPNGASYTGAASTTVETGAVAKNDTYLYDGTAWTLLHTEIPQISMDAAMSDTSRNAVENRVIKAYADAIAANIPTATSDLTNDSNFAVDANYVHTDSNYTAAEKTKLAGLSNYDDTEVKADITALDSGKVDKVTGKGLSTNDYTTTEKNKLAGIEAGAEVNDPDTVVDANYVHTDNNYTTTEKTKLAGLSNYDDTEVKADISALETGKVDVVSGKGLSTNDYTTAEKTKLQGIEAGAQVNAANTVVDANYVHTDSNFTAAEKTKLAGIAAGAEANVNADWNATSGDAQILNKPSIPQFTYTTVDPGSGGTLAANNFIVVYEA